MFRKITTNQDLRDYMRKNNVAQWELAQQMEVSEGTINKSICRGELDGDTKRIYMEMVDRVVAKRTAV